MEVKRIKTFKKIRLMILLVCLLTFSSATICHASTAISLYAHSESVSIVTTSYKALKTTACDGTITYLRYEGASSGVIALGNSSVIQVGDINSQIMGFADTTWTFTYYCIANVSNKVKLLASIYIVDNADATKESYTNKASTSLLTKNLNRTNII